MATFRYPDKTDVSSNNLSANTYYYPIQIESGNTISDVVQLGGHNVIGITTPTMTGATITVEVSLDGTNWFTLNGVSVTVAADNAFEFSTVSIFGWPYVRFVSASAEAANRTINVLIKEV
jgi:hypothetical protein